MCGCHISSLKTKQLVFEHRRTAAFLLVFKPSACTCMFLRTRCYCDTIGRLISSSHTRVYVFEHVIASFFSVSGLCHWRVSSLLKVSIIFRKIYAGKRLEISTSYFRKVPHIHSTWTRTRSKYFEIADTDWITFARYTPIYSSQYFSQWDSLEVWTSDSLSKCITSNHWTMPATTHPSSPLL